MIMNKKIINIVFSGLGGQGVLTMSDICSTVAMYEGFDVKRTDLHGLSQRGGIVESHLRIGKEIYSPLIMDGDAHYNVSLDEKLGMKFKKKYLNDDGIDLTPLLRMMKKEDIQKKEGNFFMLGILASKLSFSHDCWKSAIEDKMKNKINGFWGSFLKGVRY